MTSEQIATINSKYGVRVPLEPEDVIERLHKRIADWESRLVALRQEQKRIDNWIALTANELAAYKGVLKAEERRKALRAEAPLLACGKEEG